MKRIVTMLGALLFGAVAAASPNQADAQEAVIYACVNNSSGTIKIVSPLAVCAGNDIPLIWNAVGLEGPEGPEGPQGEPGPQGPQGPPGPAGDSAAAMQFVGFSSSSTTGAVGVLMFTYFCQEKFGPGYRMCTTEEVMNTVVLPPWEAAGTGWVRPTFVPSVGGDPPQVGGLDVSGLASNIPRNMSCDSWTSNTSVTGANFGLTVSYTPPVALGRISSTICTADRSVACCGPPLPTP